jgi:dihydrodipicolinate synthase/N-acetylneuraminate lyase
MSQSDRKERAHGIYAELATPRRAGLAEPDTAALLDYVNAIVQAGVDGLVLFGATGEFIHFDTTDRTQALKMAIRRSRVPVLANVSHSTLDGAISLANDAMDAGAGGLLLLPPYFYRYGQEEIYEFYMRFRDEIFEDMPVYLYNVASAANEISQPVAERLLSTGAFAGMNDASGNWEFFHSLLKMEQPPQLQLWIGNEQLYLRGRKHGAAGCMSGMAAAVPELLVATEHAIRACEEDRAARLQTYIQEFMDRMERLPPISGIKITAATRGWKLNHSAVPLSQPTHAESDEFCMWVRNWLPAILKECADR